MRNHDDWPFIAVVLLWLFIIAINIAWIGTLIWAIIYVVTHIGGWIHG